MNLDPAVTTVPFAANIDIRDTVSYKEVMGQYQLGPNGAIMTSLNLFATRFDQVRFRFLQLNSKGFSPQGNSRVVTYSGVSCLSGLLQVLSILEKRADELDYILIDTPGERDGRGLTSTEAQVNQGGPQGRPYPPLG